MTTKVDRSADFQIKSGRRKMLRARNAREYAAGRRNRRELAPRGAFGTEDSPVYNLCVIGTAGTDRVDNSSEQ